MRLFLATAYYGYRALFSWLHPSAYVAQKMGFPLLQLVFFTLVGRYGGGQPLEFYLIGNSVAVAFRPMFSIARAVYDERWQGTLPYLLASPANKVVLFLGRGTLYALDGTIDVAVAFLIAMLLFGLTLPLSSAPGLFAAILVATVAASGMGFFVGALAYVVLDTAFLGNTVLFMMLLFTGANVPLAELPPVAQAIGLAMPLTRTIAAARLYAGGADFWAGLPLLAADLAIGAAYSLLGVLLFRWLELQARTRGTLEGV